MTPERRGRSRLGRPSKRALAGFIGHDLAAAARLFRDQGRGPTRLRDGPRRRDGRAQGAAGHDRGADAGVLGRHRAGPARSPIVDVVCSAGTYIRALARDLGTTVGNAAYLGALRRTAAGSVRASRTLSRWTSSEPPRRTDPRVSSALLRPIDDGLERFPLVDAHADARSTRSRGASTSGPRRGIPSGADHYRLVDDRAGGSWRSPSRPAADAWRPTRSSSPRPPRRDARRSAPDGRRPRRRRPRARPWPDLRGHRRVRRAPPWPRLPARPPRPRGARARAPAHA